MTIITIALRVLNHTLIELTIDAGLAELTDDDPDTLVVNDANVIHWDNEPEP